MLKRMVAEKPGRASAVIGFWPAAQVDDDDIAVYADESRKTETARLHMLRQQMKRSNDRANYSLADFTAPAGGPPDYIGAFAVTAGIGLDEWIKREFTARSEEHTSELQSLMRI